MTGLAAVVAALIVGLRQIAITKLQVQILSNQLRLEEIELKEKLFDRRYAYYGVFRRYHSAVKSSKEVSIEIENEFREESIKAELLFPDPIKSIIDRIWNDSFDYQDHAEDKVDPSLRAVALENRRQLRKRFTENFEEFDKLVRPYMTLV